MNDFELLKALQKELIDTLQKRKNYKETWVSRDICGAKIRRLRLQIQEVMLRIERKCATNYIDGKEGWYR